MRLFVFISAEIGSELNHIIMQGITVYLKNSLSKVRTLGQHVGQLVCNAVNKDTKMKLDLPKSNAIKQIDKQIGELMEVYKWVTLQKIGLVLMLIIIFL